MQDERWEFDLDLPRSEKDDQVRDPKMDRLWWRFLRDFGCAVRIGDGPTGLWR